MPIKSTNSYTVDIGTFQRITANFTQIFTHLYMQYFANTMLLLRTYAALRDSGFTMQSNHPLILYGIKPHILNRRLVTNTLIYDMTVCMIYSVRFKTMNEYEYRTANHT